MMLVWVGSVHLFLVILHWDGFLSHTRSMKAVEGTYPVTTKGGPRTAVLNLGMEWNRTTKGLIRLRRELCPPQRTVALVFSQTGTGLTSNMRMILCYWTRTETSSDYFSTVWAMVKVSLRYFPQIRSVKWGCRTGLAQKRILFLHGENWTRQTKRDNWIVGSRLVIVQRCLRAYRKPE